MKRLICFVAAIMMLCSAAFAQAETSLTWYYNNRFAIYREYEPEKHEAIMNSLHGQVAQTPVEDADMTLHVAETAWAPEGRILVISLVAALKRPEEAELHPMINLDADGAYIGQGEVSPLEDLLRSEHWLWTDEDFGPVEDMVAPGKELLLLDACEVWLDDTQLLGDGSGWDAYTAADGTLHTVLEIRLDDAAQAMIEGSAINGNVALRIPYTLTEYTEDDDALYHDGRTGEILFELSIE